MAVAKARPSAGQIRPEPGLFASIRDDLGCPQFRCRHGLRAVCRARLPAGIIRLDNPPNSLLLSMGRFWPVGQPKPLFRLGSSTPAGPTTASISQVPAAALPGRPAPRRSNRRIPGKSETWPILQDRCEALRVPGLNPRTGHECFGQVIKFYGIAKYFTIIPILRPRYLENSTDT